MADHDEGKLIMITAPHFTAGVVVKRRAAPIIGYMNSWSLKQIEDYCHKKNWTYEIVKLEDKPKLRKTKPCKHDGLRCLILGMQPLSIIEWPINKTTSRSIRATISRIEIPFKVRVLEENKHLFVARCL